MIGLVVVFLLCMGIAALINKAMQRKAVNGAVIYLVLAVLLIGWSSVQILGSPALDAGSRAELFGKLIGSHLLVLLAAVYYARKFSRDRAQEPAATAGPTR